MYKKALSISLLITPFFLAAQSAEDFFHRGAQFYVWDQKQKATNEVFTGLKRYPDDLKLNAMAGVLKKMEEKQQQQQGQDKQKQGDQKKENQEQVFYIRILKIYQKNEP